MCHQTPEKLGGEDYAVVLYWLPPQPSVANNIGHNEIQLDIFVQSGRHGGGTCHPKDRGKH